MSAKHTPGRWVPDENGYYVRAEVYRGRKCLVDDGAVDIGVYPAICEIVPWPQHRWDFLGPEESRANQHLIASAPDLLAACKAYLAAKPQCDCSDASGCEMATARVLARAAIQKAEGDA